MSLAPLVFRGATIATTITPYSTVVVVVFNRAINSPGVDYAAGVTIQVNGGGATISAADLQADGKTVHYTLSAAADANDAITWAYSAAGGDLEDAADSTITLADVSAQSVDNYIGTQYWFQHAENSGHLWQII